jgi:protein phosphatase
MTIAIPELSLVVLIGASGSGKSTFASRHFLSTEVLSSDFCRGLVADDANDQAATGPAFEVLHFIAGKRLDAGRLTVVDATNVQREARAPLVELARAHDVLPVAIVLDMPERVCAERNAARPDRDFGRHVLRRQRQQLRRSIKGLQREGFRRAFVLRSPEEVEAAEVQRDRLWNDRRDDHGPFDIIGDVHGCFDELVILLGELGYEVAAGGTGARHPDGRRACFVGDLVDRGPDTPRVLRLVMGMSDAGTAIVVPGNHENKLLRALRGHNVQVTHGLAESLEQLDGETEEFRSAVVEFLDGLISHFVLDGGRLVVAHAGMKEKFQGRASGRVRDFALYGETTGETDEFGLPIRYEWADDYRGEAAVVYGHTPVPDARWVNNTLCVDTGCVFGGRLTALRWPEKELVSVPAVQTYYEPVRPFLAPQDQAPPGEEHRPGDVLDVEDVLGKRIIDTRLQRSITVREENAIAALEVMSRFAVDPRWLIYLPPTMAPTATSTEPGLLEHPAQAFAAYRHDGVGRVMCEEKHMGSRAVVVVCRDGVAAVRRFGLAGPAAGAIYTRTGRAFFNDDRSEAELLERVRRAIDGAGLWDELSTDWLALDCELMPWNAKANELLRAQYAPVGASGLAATTHAVELLEEARDRGVGVGDILDRTRPRVDMVEGFVDAYRRYCWDVESVDDLRLAVFVVLAGEGNLHAAQTHDWHMDRAARLAKMSDRVIMATNHRMVDLSDSASEMEAVAWWETMTDAGGEGMVVKPLDSIVGRRRGLVQPGIKVRGREYLRIIYGPEYTSEENLARLRERSLGRKRSLAQREFALGIEALERFLRGEPLYRVHECVFAVLALESEPVDPRL